MYYLRYFFITSILGFFLETIVCHGYESGILYGPWTPIYGVGSILIILISDKILKKRNINTFLKFILLFFSCFLLLTLAELIGGLLIEKIFGYSFWDYTNYKYNVGKYISLEMSMLWVLASIGFVFILRPIIDLFIDKIPNFIIYVLLILFLVDFIATLIFKTSF